LENWEALYEPIVSGALDGIGQRIIP